MFKVPKETMISVLGGPHSSTLSQRHLWSNDHEDSQGTPSVDPAERGVACTYTPWAVLWTFILAAWEAEEEEGRHPGVGNSNNHTADFPSTTLNNSLTFITQRG